MCRWSHGASPKPMESALSPFLPGSKSLQPPRCSQRGKLTHLMSCALPEKRFTATVITGDTVLQATRLHLEGEGAAS